MFTYCKGEMLLREDGSNMYLKTIKEIVKDVGTDIIGGFLISIGVYNFAVASGFPVAGISGIAVLFYHLWGVPIGVMTILLNIPISLMCYRLLGKTFFWKSVKTMLISNFMMDQVAPLLPVYRGELILASICIGIFGGMGFALVYARGTSTGGADFIFMAVRKWKPHLSLGKIIIIFDFVIIIVGGALMGGNIESIIYGLIGSYILSVVVDKAMYGVNAGKMTLIVTENGQKVADKIAELIGRGSTLLQGVGSYSKDEKEVVMCACSNKQMYMVQKAVKEVDEEAFLVILESSEVRGKGFQPH